MRKTQSVDEVEMVKLIEQAVLEEFQLSSAMETANWFINICRLLASATVIEEPTKRWSHVLSDGVE